MLDAIVRTLVRLYVTRRRPARVGDRGAGEVRASALELPGVLPPHGARPSRGRRRRRGDSSPPCDPRAGRWRRRSSCSGCCRPLVARRISLPPRRGASRAAGAAHERAAPPHRPADLALLRDVRRPRGQRAAARQLPGGPEAGRRAPHLADEHRPLSARRRSPRAISAGSACSTRVERLEATLDTLFRMERFRGHLLQLVRHAHAAPARSAATSRRSTAAISPATCSRWRRPAASRSTAPLLAPERAGGHRRRARARARVRRGAADDRRTQTLGRRASRRCAWPSSKPRSSARAAHARRMGALARASWTALARHPGRRRADAGRRARRRQRRRAARLGARPSPPPCAATRAISRRCCRGRPRGAATT